MPRSRWSQCCFLITRVFCGNARHGEPVRLHLNAYLLPLRLKRKVFRTGTGAVHVHAHGLIGKSYIVHCVICAAILLLSCAAVAQDTLTIVSPHWQGIRYEFERAFKDHLKQQQREVKFRWLEVGGTSEILKFIRSEFTNKPDGIDVDLLFGGGIDPFLDLKERGLLLQTKLSAQALNGVAERLAGGDLRDLDGYWYAPTVSAFGILCNRQVLQRLNLPQPESWRDLTQAGFRSWVRVADPRRSGSAHFAFEVILQGYGWSQGWATLVGISKNSGSYIAASSQIASDVLDGQAACGLTIDSQAAQAAEQAGPEQLSFVVPKDAAAISGDGIAVLKGAPHPQLAAEFIEFLLSESGQRIWMARKGSVGGPTQYVISRFAIRPKLYRDLAGNTDVMLNPFEFEHGVVMDFKKGAARWSILNDLIGVFLANSSDSVKSDAPLEESVISELALKWSDTRFRSETIADWRKQVSSPSAKIEWYEFVPLGAVFIFLMAVRFTTRKNST